MSPKQHILVRRRIPVASACIRIIIRIIHGRLVFHAFCLIHKVKFATFVVGVEEVLLIWAIFPIFLAKVIDIIRVPYLGLPLDRSTRWWCGSLRTLWVGREICFTTYGKV
jgi:hypothetical protein